MFFCVLPLGICLCAAVRFTTWHPSCQQEQVTVLRDQRAMCILCSKALRCVYQFCWACRWEWQGDKNCCDLPGCGIRAAFLSDAVITDPASSVVGCPFFRACPSCKALLTHSGEECQTSFCFRCLRVKCDGVFDDRWLIMMDTLTLMVIMLNHAPIPLWSGRHDVHIFQKQFEMSTRQTT